MGSPPREIRRRLPTGGMRGTGDPSGQVVRALPGPYVLYEGPTRVQYPMRAEQVSPHPSSEAGNDLMWLRTMISTAAGSCCGTTGSWCRMGTVNTGRWRCFKGLETFPRKGGTWWCWEFAFGGSALIPPGR